MYRPSLNAIRPCRQKDNITLTQLQSLLGKLNFFTKAISTGRAFVRRMHDATIGILYPHRFIRLEQDTKEEMQL